MTANLRNWHALWTFVCVLAFGFSVAASPRDDKPNADEPKNADAKKEAPKKPPIYDSTLDARRE
jgi:hypothetical protein